jgi:hypothetical protein
MVAPGILVTSVSLYAGAIGWGLFQGADTFLSGILSGCGSIAMGVWLGVVVASRPDLIRQQEEDDDG